MTGIEAWGADQIIYQMMAGLITAALYAATYLSFVRLLRYPRTWYRPSWLSILATGFLAVLTVAQVSFTNDGPDLAAMVLSAGCFMMLCFIISAPAVAFRPANQAVEFLAKHAEYASLWLLGPALVVALAGQNTKLQVMLATAMAIELSWFLRQHWARRERRLYPLNDIDLSVLATQAKGDLEAFQRRHGMAELVLSEGAVSWQGCGKNTPPCPFNFYVNHLGLNTAPCCREHMQDVAHYVATCLREIGAVHWLEGGSLLGAVREKGELLAWEDDVDISVLLDADMTWEKLTAGLAERCLRDGYFLDHFEKKGFVSVSFDQPKSWPFKWERGRLRGEIRVDIATYRRVTSYGKAVLERRSHKGDMPVTESGAYGISQEIVLPISTIRFLGSNIACPNKSVSYLRVLYGDFEEIDYTYIDPAAAETRRQADLANEPAVTMPMAS